MRIAASNLGLPAFDHLPWLGEVSAMGAKGLEVVPGRTWAETPDAGAVSSYRRAVEAAGLSVVGLHGLLWERPDLGLLGDLEVNRRTVDYLAELSSVCRDLGGRTLVLDARRCNGLPRRGAWHLCREVLDRLLPRMEEHGTVLCFAPIGDEDGDFCTTAKDCYLMVNAVDSPAFGIHLGAAGLLATGENGHATFAAVRGRLELFHADEPGLTELGRSGRVDHADLRRHLAAISYFDWVSVVQRAVPDDRDALDSLRRAVAFVTERYLPLDTR